MGFQTWGLGVRHAFEEYHKHFCFCQHRQIRQLIMHTYHGVTLAGLSIYISTRKAMTYDYLSDNENNRHVTLPSIGTGTHCL